MLKKQHPIKRTALAGFSTENNVVFSSEIKDAIQSLYNVNFGDIKNQIGTKFKMLNEFTYTIVKRYENDEPLILDSDNNVYPLNYLNDNEVNLIKGKNAWFAEDGERLRVVNENPCRAVAECFLLMKDKEKEKADEI